MTCSEFPKFWRTLPCLAPVNITWRRLINIKKWMNNCMNIWTTTSHIHAKLTNKSNHAGSSWNMSSGHRHINQCLISVDWLMRRVICPFTPFQMCQFHLALKDICEIKWTSIWECNTYIIKSFIHYDLNKEKILASLCKAIESHKLHISLTW